MKTRNKRIPIGWKSLLAGLLLTGAGILVPPGSIHAANPHCFSDPGHPGCKSSDGSGEEDVPQTRVRMSDWVLGSGGISGDGLDSCNGYDYWAQDDAGLIQSCTAHQIRSGTSGGGRWFLIFPADHEVLDIQRWLVFDFSVSDNGDPCPNFEGDGTAGDSIYSSAEMDPASTNPDPCVDNLAVWVGASRALKKNATRSDLGIRIRHRTDDGQYWRDDWILEHINPLYVRNPIPGHDTAYENFNCRLLTTFAGPDDSDGDVHEAELHDGDGTGPSALLGTYDLPFEVCLVRASDDE